MHKINNIGQELKKLYFLVKVDYVNTNSTSAYIERERIFCFCIYIFVFACFSVVLCQKPTLRLLSSYDDNNEKASFACFAKHFSPKDFKITWLINNDKITDKTVEEKTTRAEPDITNENGTLYSAASFITLPKELSQSGKIKCKFTTEKVDCQQTDEHEVDIRPQNGPDGKLPLS